MSKTMRQRMKEAEARCKDAFARIDEIAFANTGRVLDAFQRARVAVRHFAPTTGYGYGDVGRDTLDSIFADLFGTEAALVRPQIASGTHALAVCLFGLLQPGDHLLSATGRPYDTLRDVIGLDGPEAGSLREMGISYSQVELGLDGLPDIQEIRGAMRKNTRLVAVQRSRGYSERRSLMPVDMRPLSAMLKAEFPSALLMADNCYGEFVCLDEPTHHGADICVGSLIKNPGGGLAPAGGYIVGPAALVDRCGYRLTAPGIGREVGSYGAGYQPFYQGLFMAPHTVAQALKTATLAAALLEGLGIGAAPSVDEVRSDTIQALELGSPERLIAFCRGIQAASPIDSMAIPEPSNMPGYQSQIIMAAGTFVGGASIELSADAPIRPPYVAYLQGGLTYSHGKLALWRTLEGMKEEGYF